MSSKFPCSMIQKKNKEILILPLKAPLQPKKRFAVGLFSNSRKSLFFPSKQIIMKEIAIMTGAKKYERIIERKQKERKAMERKTAWNEYKKKDMKKLEKLNAGYRAFLDHGKTERECVKESVRQAEEAGYVSLDTYVKENRALKPGDKVYAVCMKKAIALFQIGTKLLTEGMNILGAHIDSPRLDVKQNPLYEDNGFTYLDTHYYGGIKKWQWVTLPLAIHGVVAKKDGEVVDVVIGEDDNDPVFCVTDLLIHLAGKQLQKKAADDGFDWPDIQGALSKLDEEVGELHQAVQDGANVAEELGDVLFAAVKAARFAGVDPEDALNAACEKFIRRYGAVEQGARDRGVSVSDLTLEEMTGLWNAAK